MKMCGLTVSDPNFGIQWHIVAMYGPSFFTGSLIARLGAPTTSARPGAEAPPPRSPPAHTMHFWATLIVLGGLKSLSSALPRFVLETQAPAGRNKQAFNDFPGVRDDGARRFRPASCWSYGWSMVNMVVFPPVLLGLAVLLLHSSPNGAKIVDGRTNYRSGYLERFRAKWIPVRVKKTRQNRI